MIRVLRLLRAAAGSDRDLLERYVRDRDGGAFEALVRRYGPGVWAACVRLANRDAEDAFQAVFLTLSRKAGTVTGSLPAWLHAVARRVAANLRRNARRRTEAEAAVTPTRDRFADDAGLREGLALLDEELSRLPDHYRAVLIVCCLEGRSRDEAAEQLGWSEAQVKGRLERARQALRTRLARRGVELGGLLLAAATTVSAPVHAGPPSAVAVSLTNGVIRAMTIQKLKLAAAVVALWAGIVVAGGVALRAQPGDPPVPVSPDPKTPVGKPGGVSAPQDKVNPPDGKAEDSAKTIKDLQKERIATLKELVKQSEVLAQNSRINVAETLEARLQLLKAELDAAESGAERLALYKKTIEVLTQYEELASAMWKAGRGMEAAVLKVKARRLEVEIEFEQTKMKEAKERK